MSNYLKLLSLALLGAILLGLAGCADATTDSTYSPSETPSKDDLSRGWGPTQSQ